jgi:hypothetical protein
LNSILLTVVLVADEKFAEPLVLDEPMLGEDALRSPLPLLDDDDEGDEEVSSER